MGDQDLREAESSLCIRRCLRNPVEPPAGRGLGNGLIYTFSAGSWRQARQSDSLQDVCIRTWPDDAVSSAAATTSSTDGLFPFAGSLARIHFAPERERQHTLRHDLAGQCQTAAGETGRVPQP